MGRWEYEEGGKGERNRIITTALHTTASATRFLLW